MVLKILGSSSKGNAYLLKSNDGSLLIDCGFNFKKILTFLNFDLSSLDCICTHIDGDHSKSVIELLNAGINVFASKHTHEKKGSINHRNAKIVEAKKQYQIGQFKVIPFDVFHDVPTFGFLINHAECGNVLFATDTYYLKNTFPGLNNIIIEANYCDEILQQRIDNGANTYLSDRVIKSHMSIQNCIKALESNDLSNVNNIVLIHLSDGNSNAIRFKEIAENATGKNVTIADVGVEISFNKTPF